MSAAPEISVPEVCIDSELIARYGGTGPRYTSYPTALHFSDEFTVGEYRKHALRSNEVLSPSPLSVYVHIPFCQTLCYYCACNKFVTRNANRVNTYMDRLYEEIDLQAALFDDDRVVEQIHFGGGTPTYLSDDQLRDLLAHLRKNFSLQTGSEREFSIEVDPRSVPTRSMDALTEIGFNRLSLGVQDFDPQVQQAVNRIQSAADTIALVEHARSVKFKSISFDLIYGLPFQTVPLFEETVQKILRFDPDRIAVFNYAHVPWLKPHQKLIQSEDLPTPEEKLSILKMTIEVLTSHGYEYIGMDHFAKPNDELTIARKEKTLYRNFQGYSTKAGADLYGFGMSSISHFENIYAQNFKPLADYYKALDAGKLATHVGYRMTEDDYIRKYVIMRLMCDLEVDKSTVEERYSINFDEYFDSSLRALEQFVDDGLVHMTPDRITIIGAGRLLLRNIAMCFDAYLDTMSPAKPIFSRTV